MGSRGGMEPDELAGLSRPSQQLPLLPGDANAGVGDGPRGPGRPKGARNRRTRELIDWMKGSGEMPAEFLVRIMRSSPDELASELTSEGDAVGRLDIIKLQVRAAEVLMPYVEQKLPLAIEDATDSKRMLLVMGDLTTDQRAVLEARTGLRLANGDGRARTQLDQRVIDASAVATATKSDDDQSDDADNALVANDK